MYVYTYVGRCIHIYLLKTIEILTANTTLNAKRIYFTKLMPHERILNFIWFLIYLFSKKKKNVIKRFIIQFIFIF